MFQLKSLLVCSLYRSSGGRKMKTESRKHLISVALDHPDRLDSYFTTDKEENIRAILRDVHPWNPTDSDVKYYSKCIFFCCLWGCGNQANIFDL